MQAIFFLYNDNYTSEGIKETIKVSLGSLAVADEQPHDNMLFLNRHLLAEEEKIILGLESENIKIFIIESEDFNKVPKHIWL